jgi:hypothetical protein
VIVVGVLLHNCSREVRSVYDTRRPLTLWVAAAAIRARTGGLSAVRLAGGTSLANSSN